MIKTIHKDGVVLNGRRYNHSALQHHLCEQASVDLHNENQVAISINGKLICIADAQDPISLADIEPKKFERFDRVKISTGVFAGSLGTIWSFQGNDCYKVIADADPDNTALPYSIDALQEVNCVN